MMWGYPQKLEKLAYRHQEFRVLSIQAVFISGSNGIHVGEEVELSIPWCRQRPVAVEDGLSTRSWVTSQKLRPGIFTREKTDHG